MRDHMMGYPPVVGDSFTDWPPKPYPLGIPRRVYEAAQARYTPLKFPGDDPSDLGLMLCLTHGDYVALLDKRDDINRRTEDAKIIEADAHAARMEALARCVR